MKVKDYIRSLNDDDMVEFFCQGGFGTFDCVGHVWCNKRQSPSNLCTGNSCEECTKIFMESDIEDLLERLEQRRNI